LKEKKLILILILITGKLILIEFPINWLTMKVTNFVIDFRRSRCTTVQYSDSCNLLPLQWSRLYCIVYYRCSGLWWNSAI